MMVDFVDDAQYQSTNRSLSRIQIEMKYSFVYVLLDSRAKVVLNRYSHSEDKYQLVLFIYFAEIFLPLDQVQFERHDYSFNSNRIRKMKNFFGKIV